MFDEAHAAMIILSEGLSKRNNKLRPDWKQPHKLLPCIRLYNARRQDGDWLEYMHSGSLQTGA